MILAGRQEYTSLPFVYTQNRLMFAIYSGLPSRSKPFIQNQERSRVRLDRRTTAIRLIRDLGDTVPRMWQYLGASQKAMGRFEVLTVHVSFGEVVKALPNSIYEFALVVGENCNPMHQSDSAHRIGIFVQPVTFGF